MTGALALTDGGSGTWTIEMGTLASDDNNYTPVLNLAGVTFTYIDQDPASVDVTLTPDGNDGWHKSEITFKADNFEAALTGSSDLKSTPAYGEVLFGTPMAATPSPITCVARRHRSCMERRQT